MANMNNPPQVLGPRIRLIVKARSQLPKKFLWEIVADSGTGGIRVLETSSEVYDTMETAYQQGTPMLATVRTRLGR